MGSFLFRPGMDGVLAWVILVAVGVSGLCILALATMLFVGRYRMHRRRKQSLRAAVLLRGEGT